VQPKLSLKIHPLSAVLWSCDCESKDPSTVGSVMKLWLWTEPRIKPHIKRSNLKRGHAVGLITPVVLNHACCRDENRYCETRQSVWWNMAAIHSSNYDTARMHGHKSCPVSLTPFWCSHSAPPRFRKLQSVYRKWTMEGRKRGGRPVAAQTLSSGTEAVIGVLQWRG